MKPTFTQRGFTIVELLFVISIISLISTIVISCVSDTRYKAKITAIETFANHNYHALGAYATAIFNFNEGSGTTVLNDGSGLDGTLAGNATFDTNTFNGKGYALKLDGSGDYVDFPSNYTMLDGSTGSHTISFWLYPKSLTSLIPVNHTSGARLINFHIYTISSTQYILYGHQGGSPDWATYVIPASKKLSLDTWQHFLYVWDDKDNGTFTGTNSLYINGILVHSQGRTASPGSTGGEFRIGCYGTNYCVNGMMDDVMVFSEALTSAQVKEIYANSLPYHLANK